jgi:hypothetical protein
VPKNDIVLLFCSLVKKNQKKFKGTESGKGAEEAKSGEAMGAILFSQAFQKFTFSIELFRNYLPTGQCYSSNIFFVALPNFFLLVLLPENLRTYFKINV